MQELTTSSEFVDWCVFYDELWVDINELYHYLAQLAYFVFAPHAKEGWSGRPTDFLLKVEKQVVSTPETRAAHAQNSKNIWIGMAKASWENRDKGEKHILEDGKWYTEDSWKEKNKQGVRS